MSEYIRSPPMKTKYIRSLPVKIETVEVIGKTQVHGWKVYINGEKYPGKSVEYYQLSEEQAIEAAIIAYKTKYGVE